MDLTRINRPAIERKVRTGSPRGTLGSRARPTDTRQTLREMFSGPIVVGGGRDDRFEGELVIGSLMAGAMRDATYVVRPAGLEPATPGLEGRCSIH